MEFRSVNAKSRIFKDIVQTNVDSYEVCRSEDLNRKIVERVDNELFKVRTYSTINMYIGSGESLLVIVNNVIRPMHNVIDQCNLQGMLPDQYMQQMNQDIKKMQEESVSKANNKLLLLI